MLPLSAVQYSSHTLSPNIALMDARRDSTTLYPYSSHHSTWDASGVSQSHSLPLHNPQQYPHPQLPRQAIPQGQILDAMMRQEYAHDYSYNRDPSSPTSYSPRQPTPPIANNHQLYNNGYHGSSDPHRSQTNRMSYDHTQTQYALMQQSPITNVPVQYPASPTRPFPCDMCALSFNRQHDLKRHRDTHNGEKPFSCDPCGKTFTRKDALKRHQVRERSLSLTTRH